VIEYAPPQIDRVQLNGRQLNLSFTAQANQTYSVEFRDLFSTASAWFTLTNVAAPPVATNFTILDSVTNGQRYYRLRLP